MITYSLFSSQSIQIYKKGSDMADSTKKTQADDSSIVELVSGFDSYAQVDELNQVAVGEAPESRVPCSIYFTVGGVASATAANSC